MVKISNKEVYLHRMQAGLEDKLFFVSEFSYENFDGRTLFIDYGCADGSLIRALSNLYPLSYFCGYDADSDFIKKAQTLLASNKFFTDSWTKVIEFSRLYEKKVLILSSVLHEVYSYSYDEKFWEEISQIDWNYICIRDMGMSEESLTKPCTKEQYLALSEWESKEPRIEQQRHEFEKEFGRIISQERLSHFLLKYPYIENWAREVKENYLPITVERLNEKMRERGYIKIYFKHWVLPYVKEKVERDSGIVMVYNTHFKGIWRKS